MKRAQAANKLKPEKSKLLRYLKSYLPFWQNKKIGFYGNFGHGDLGDDASFISAHELLNNELLPISKRCYAFNPAMLKSLLIGGGGILRWESPYIPRRILEKKSWNFPVILFSAGINCDYNKQFSLDSENKIKKLCSACSYITVRDQITRKFINNLGFNKVSVLPDLELILKERSKKLDFKKDARTVGIVLSPHSEFASGTFKSIIDAFSGFTNYLTEKGNNVIYLPFEKKISENTKEYEITKEILKAIKFPQRVKILEEYLEPDEMLYAIRNCCDVMVCMRLHSAIFSVNAGIPFICISYNLMHKGFLEMMDMQDLDIPLFDNFSQGSLIEKFEYLLKNYSEISQRLIHKKKILTNMIYKEISYIKENFLK